MSPTTSNGPGLAAGTLVTTPDGEKRIEDVVAGDLVLSGIGEGYTRFCEVKNVFALNYCGPMLFVRAEIDPDSEDYLPLLIAPDHLCFSLSLKDEPKENSVILLAFDSHDGGGLKPDHAIYTKHLAELETSLDRAEEMAHQMSKDSDGVEIERFAAFGCNRGFQHGETYRFMFAKNLKVSMSTPIFNIYTKVIDQAEINYIEAEIYNGLIYTLNIPQSRNFAANGILVHDSST